MNQEKFLRLRKEYPKFYFHSYKVMKEEDSYEIEYSFSIPSLCEFHPTIKIYKENILYSDEKYIDYLAYQIGLVELVSYWKCTCSPTIVIEAGPLTKEQKEWFLKLYYLGLGEFRYVNGIQCEEQEFLTIEAKETLEIPNIEFSGVGNLVAIGGGKDSAVTLEILREEENTCFMINPKEPGIACMKEAGYSHYLKVERKIDKELIRLNQEGF